MRLALLEAFPNDHRAFIQLVIALGIKVHQYAFAAVKISDHDMLAGAEIS